MRVTLLCASMDLSGGSRIISTYARMLANHGHRVTVVALAPRPIPLRRRLREFIRTGRWLRGYRQSHYDGLGLDIRVVQRSPMLDEHVPNADVVVATWWETAEWANAFRASKGTKVYFVQGHEVWSFLPVERARATYRMPFVKIVVSGWLKQIMESEYGDFQTVLVPNAFDPAMFHAEVREKRAVPTVGFMYARGGVKASEVAVEALLKLKRLVPDLRVVSFGTSRAIGLDSLGGDFTFHLLPSSEDIRASYTACDAWLCSSRSEGFGLPAMEAMACRTPVISTRVGWALDAIEDGVNGFLVPVDDAEVLCAAVLRCLKLAPDEWRAMSDRAYRTAHSYNWERSYSMFEAALKEAVARGRSVEV